MERQLKGIQNSLERIDSARLVFLEQQLQKEYDDILFKKKYTGTKNQEKNGFNLETRTQDFSMLKPLLEGSATKHMV